MRNKKLFYIILIVTLIVIPYTVDALMANCPLGPEVVKDIKGVLRIFQILGPLITVIFTIWEIIRGLAKGEIDKELKTIWQRTFKRVIAAFLLFFIPLLLNLLFQIFGLYDTSSCDFDNPGEAGPRSARSCADAGLTYNEETKQCGKEATDEQICNAYNGREGDTEDRVKCEAKGCTYNWNTGNCNAKEETKCYLLNGQPSNNEHAARCEARTGCTYDMTSGKCNRNS